jgi:hypothetical protein
MDLEKQVCSLELAKKLKELGVKQESLFRWEMYHAGDRFVLTTDTRREPNEYNEEYAAFTVAELLSLIGKPMIVPAEGGADVLAEELIAMYGTKGN